ncbi:MAG: cytochrome [Halioglobus sp.]|nr:cytochrome [Halioglobus sp.]|tara:strand:+ start:5513 stop:6763 length:1251 start_codon:yes stop_codon:yes gene_type:complete
MTACPYRNLLDPDLYGRGGHHEALRELRDSTSAPIIKIEDPLTGVPYWAVLSRDLADDICKNPGVFSSTAQTAIPTEMSKEQVAAQSQMLVNMDPPKHQKYRRIARNAFTPKAVDAYQETFQRYAREIVDAVAPRGECEFVSEVAAELPLMAILDLCGVPKDDRAKIFQWTNEMFFQEDEDFAGDNPKERAENAAAQMYFYADELASRHKEKPLNNIVGALLDGIVEGEKLTTDEFQMFFLMLIAAGNESTRSVTAHGMRLLMEHPEQLQLLIDRPELIPDAIEEVLRYNPAFVGMRRTVMEDIQIGGEQLREGDKLILNWHLINTDDAVFDAPFEFDITRAQRMPDLHREHRAFGIGQHFCLGSHLARLELNVVFSEVLPRLRNPQFAEPVKYVRDFFVNGIKEMKITFDPERAG